MHGSVAYDNKNWVDVIENMEESLAAYLTAADECRAQCEGPFDQGWYPDLIPSISSKCAASVTKINERFLRNFQIISPTALDAKRCARENSTI